MGATIARCAAEGVHIELICATNGEAGEVAPGFMEGYDSIAALRRAELRCAADVLGIREVHLFDYCDSGMTGSEVNKDPLSFMNADFDEVVARTVAVIHQMRPHVVVTFDPRGGYGHPDHILMYRATVAAFEAAGADGGYRPQRLYHMTFGRFTRYMLRLMILMARLRGQDPTRMGKNEDIDLTEFAGSSYPVHVRVNIKDYLPIGDQASRCHASQIEALESMMPLWVRKLFMGAQSFTQIAPPPNPGPIANDLFHGVET